MIKKLLNYLYAIALILSSIFLFASLVSFCPKDISYTYDSSQINIIKNYCGITGAHAASFFLYLFGCAAFLLVPILLLCGLLILNPIYFGKYRSKIFSLSLLIFFLDLALHLNSFEYFNTIQPGGLVGTYTYILLSKVLDFNYIYFFAFISLWATLILVIQFAGLQYITNFMNLVVLPICMRISLFFKNSYSQALGFINKYKRAPTHEDLYIAPVDQDPFWQEYLNPGVKVQEKNVFYEEVASEKAYTFPSLAILTEFKSQKSSSKMRERNNQLAKILEHKLDQFGIKGEVVAITSGPVITLFEYQPAIDTKISNITAREHDLALALEAFSLRVIAPIPGKSVVGFEVAHSETEIVSFKELIQSNSFKQTTANLPLILGKDTLGADIVVDLVKMPHLLIAGSTGSGKSVGLHSLIMSLLFRKTPRELKLILIDPKRLEFFHYTDIPHLLFPVIIEPSRATLVLKWALNLMQTRYDMMAKAGVRNIQEYNVQAEDNNKLEYVVIIIDELADLMMTAGKEVEYQITRLAQMARAAGMHLIVATQRPSVDVITGLIKVNFPSRIAFKVTSKVDSRTIIDSSGAEKLLGRGDMLFLDPAGSLQRIQGVFVPDNDIKSVVQHLKSQQAVKYEELIIESNSSMEESEADEIYNQVISFIRSKNEVSISLLQRVFKIGYNRSARIIEKLETEGHVLPADGAKMRKVIKSP